MENAIYISIIIPAYNSEKTVGKAIESLLSQNFPADKYEIIVVDNCSKDKTVNIVKGYPARIVTCRKRGSYSARNEGARYAKGEILAFTDADCEVDKNWLNEIEKTFKDSNLHAVQGQGNFTHKKELRVKTECFIDEYITEIMRMREKKIWGDTRSFAIRKCVFKEVGGFIPFKSGCDILFVEKLLRRSYNVKVNKRMIAYHNYSLNLRRIIERSLRYGLGDLILAKSNGKSRLGGLVDILSFYRLVTQIIFLRHNTFLKKLQMCSYFWTVYSLRTLSYIMGSYFNAL